MSLKFQVRGTQLDAYHAPGGAGKILYNSGANLPPALLADAGAGIISGSLIACEHTADVRSIGWPAKGNFPTTPEFSALIRAVPRFSGNPAGTNFLFGTTSPWNNLAFGFVAYIAAGGNLVVTLYDGVGTSIANINQASGLTFVAGTPIEVMITWDGTTNSNQVIVYVNGAPWATATASSALLNRDDKIVGTILATSVLGNGLGDFDINEIVLWDSVEPVADFARTSFITATALDGSVYTDPLDTNVKNGIAYTFAGVAKTGTLLSTDPGVGNVVKGIAYAINSAAKVGALDFGDPAIQQDMDVGAVTILQGSSLELWLSLKQKLAPAAPLDLTSTSEIVAKFQKADGTTLSVTMGAGAVSIRSAHAGQILIRLTSTQTAGLKVGSGVPLTLTLTADGADTAIYDLSGRLTVAKPTIV